MKKLIFLLVFSVFLFSCNMQEDKNIKTTKEFYKIFSERKDISKLMDLYSNDAIWEEAVTNTEVKGKQEIKNTFNWEDKNYKKHPAYPESITIINLLANDSIVAVSGKYNPYYYNGNLVNEMPFTAWFYFNKEGKIQKQVEWMQYSLSDLNEIINFKTNARIE